MRNVKGRNQQQAAVLKKLMNVYVLEVEVTNTASVKQAIQNIIQQQGRIDVVINNAGHFISGLAETFTDKDIDNIFDVHVKGSWHTIKEALPYMRKQGEGLIINTSSVLG